MTLIEVGSLPVPPSSIAAGAEPGEPGELGDEPDVDAGERESAKLHVFSNSEPSVLLAAGDSAGTVPTRGGGAGRESDQLSPLGRGTEGGAQSPITSAGARRAHSALGVRGREL